ncbi:hypothetical protein ACJVDH_15550 [Pedobacter sp. AW1-32]
MVNENNVFVAVNPVGKDGIFTSSNSRTGAVTKGAKLINKTDNHYAGVF